MMSLPIAHVNDVYDSISTSINPLTTKLHGKQDHHTMTLPCWWYVATTRPRDQLSQLYLYFYKPYKNQTSQKGRLACTDLTLKMKMMSWQLGHVNNVYDSISTSMNPITIKLHRKQDQHVLTLSCWWWWNHQQDNTGLL